VSVTDNPIQQRLITYARQKAGNKPGLPGGNNAAAGPSMQPNQRPQRQVVSQQRGSKRNSTSPADEVCLTYIVNANNMLITNSNLSMRRYLGTINRLLTESDLADHPSVQSRVHLWARITRHKANNRELVKGVRSSHRMV